ncbi:MAG: hypothetical protein KJ000_28890 [Pirellulaceae bacterium]|nr:hypothetical protein [Pirellulaceae bacterium]
MIQQSEKMVGNHLPGTGASGASHLGFLSRTWAFIIVTLCMSAMAGAGAGLLLLQADDANDTKKDIKSITGVSSGVEGSQVDPLDTEGVDQVPLTAEMPETDPKTTEFEIMTTNDGSMQSIRGIQGIDTVLLQNLESVLRMQAPPPPPEEGGGGAARAAAALLTMENEEPLEPENQTDLRDQLTELEGS